MHNKKRTLAVAALSLLGASAAEPYGYGERAKQLIRKLYSPVGAGLRVIIGDSQLFNETDTTDPDAMNVFDLNLVDERNGANPSVPGWCRVPVLSAHFAFEWQTRDKELFILAVSGPSVEGRRDKFAEDLNRHPEWTSEQIAAELNKVGARFGPDHKAELLRALPLKELKPFTGELEVVSAEFYARHSNGEVLEALLNWRVTAKWHGPGGRTNDCILGFEPFEGRLTSFYRLLH